MNINKIAGQLVNYCRQGDWNGAYNTLYAETIVSIEPYPTPYFQKETIGLEAVQAKATVFETLIENLHRLEVSDPLIVGNFIAFTITIDAVQSNIGRVVSTELCVYTVGNGKVIKEELLYE